ncbi:HDOD domain-containing protein [Thauera sp. ZXT1-4]|uniref:HDOD domain-containing protein n=1 Tax=Thauera sp. ZXT1-4 TaxID=3460294 RepID=UPI0040407C0B
MNAPLPPLDTDSLRAAAARLPALPSVAVELITSLDAEEADAESLAEIISRDQTLAARLLRIANSSFYGMPGRIHSIRDAIMLIGLRGVRSLAIAASLSGAQPRECPGLSLQHFWRHSTATAIAAQELARRNQLPADLAFLASLLHDIGKIGLPDTLLARSVTDMNGEDTHLYRKHPVTGEQALMALEDLHGAAKLVRGHHERFDGKGFPDGLLGEFIPIGARILSVANDFDSLQIGTIAPRRMSAEAATRLIVDYSGKRYDPDVVEAFLAVTSAVEAPASNTEERALNVDMLEPGMVLTRDLMSRQGYLMLAADFTLTRGIIRQIADYAEAENLPQLQVFVRIPR